MQKMDVRKQKRLGAAPIASFEKSFEDTISATASATATTATTIGQAAAAPAGSMTYSAQQPEQQQALAAGKSTVHANGVMLMMESHERITKIATTITDTAKTRNIQQQLQKQPSIAISKSESNGSNINRPTPPPPPPPTKILPSSNNTNATIATTTTSTLVNYNAAAAASGQQQAQAQAQCNNNNFKAAMMTTLTAPTTPRIELSRASSSSQHEEDSRESSPENVFEQVGTGTLQETIGVGFGEEGALELRSSTEELYFMDPEQKKEEREKMQQQQQQQQTKRASPHIFRFDEHQSYLQQHQRKDSASSEVAALLCISGRTSRISSVGSQGSAVSRLSAISGVSRSPSPHRMLLETSFCGPKPVENVVDGRVATNVEPPTAELLEQVLLARNKHDPTQAVLAEGITVESSPQKKKTATTLLSNGEAATLIKRAERPNAVGIAVAGSDADGRLTLGGAQQRRNSNKSPGQMVVGKAPSGKEYIRINLKPDYMYEDKGIAPHEKLVEAPNSIAPLYAPRSSSSQKKPAPATLSLGGGGGRSAAAVDETKTRLTPSASPKPTRHAILSAHGGGGSRSPSPATAAAAATSVSRKSSFSSLFRLGGGGGGKDSPDSPHEHSRSRSKSKERTTPQSQGVTPNKQKSVLAIFKPAGKRGSNASVGGGGGGGEAKSTSKTASPSGGDGQHDLQQQLQQQRQRSKSHTPSSSGGGGGSRPASRLRYYDEAVDGVIHIPLHTPPEEKEARQLLQGIQQLTAEPVRAIPTAITASQLAAAAAALKPVGARKGSASGSSGSGQSQIMRPQQQMERVQTKIDANLDAIHTLSSQDDPNDDNDDDNKERTWSLEVNKYSSSQDDSQELNAAAAAAAAAATAAAAAERECFARAIKNKIKLQRSTRTTATTLADVQDKVVESGVQAEIHRLPSVESTGGGSEAAGRIIETVASINMSITQVQQPENEHTKEKRRLLFTTRLGSGSQDPIFSTQFSISKTESQSSQLSEQMQETIAESPESENFQQRRGTVIRRAEDGMDEMVSAATASKAQPFKTAAAAATRRRSSTEAAAATVAARRQKSISTSEDEKPHVQTTTVTAVVMRRKNSNSEESRARQSRSTSEEDGEIAAAAAVANQRHSRYLENFDVRKKYHENVPRKPKRQSGCVAELQLGAESNGEPNTAGKAPHEDQAFTKQPQQRKPTLPQPPPPSTAPSPSPPPTAAVCFVVGSSRSPTPPTRAPRSRSQSQSPSEHSGGSKQTPIKPPRTSTPPKRRTQITTAAAAAAERQSMPSTDEPVESSESERDSDLAGGGSSTSAAAVADPKRRHLPARHVVGGAIEEHESTGLVSQESFDELPYVPTTLPEERAQGVALIPMKERANMELKMCPVERPRSTTPLNPSHLEEYCGIAVTTPHAEQHASYELGSGGGSAPVRGEKLRISLPRKDSTKERPQSAKSPRRASNASGKSWFEFAEEGLRANLERKDSSKQQQKVEVVESKTKTKAAAAVTPTLAHSKTTTITVQTKQHSQQSKETTTTQRKLSGHWIDFENIPEKRKPPKRITALPKDGLMLTAQPAGTTSSSSGSGGGGSRSHASNAKTAAHAAHSQQAHGHHGHGHQATAPHMPQPPDVTMDGKIHYNYVKPEDCACECHESKREAGEFSGHAEAGAAAGTTTEDELERLASSKSISSVDLLQQGEDMLPLLDAEIHDGIEPSDSSREYSCYTDDEMDVPLRQTSSSRSRSSSSKLNEFPRRDGGTNSPRNRKFPGHRK